MRNKIIFGLLVMIIFDLGCKKDNSQTGIQSVPFVPLSYLPVYPGSYWTYKNGNDTTTSSTADTLTYFQGKYCSTLDGVLIWHYHKWLFHSSFFSEWADVLSDTVGLKFTYWLGDPRYHAETIHYTVLQKTKDEKGDSVIIQKSVVYSGIPPYNPARQWVCQVYKKGIGLSFECGIDSVTKDTNYKKVLINYFINRCWTP